MLGLGDKCSECGTNLKEKDICLQCVALEDTVQAKTKPNHKGTVTAVIIAFTLFGVILLGQTLMKDTKGKVVELFEQALEEQSVDELRQLIIHENLIPPRESEINALLKLIEAKSGDTSFLQYEAVKVDKKYFVFPEYKIKLNSQYVKVDIVSDEVTYTFNDANASKSVNDTYDFGPLLPGMYEVKVAYMYEFELIEQEKTVEINQSNNHTALAFDLPIKMVQVEIDNADLANFSAFARYEFENFPIRADGKSEAFGPVILDGNDSVDVIFSMPYGSVTSKTQMIEAEIVPIEVEYLNFTQFEKIIEQLKHFRKEFNANLRDKESTIFTGNGKQIAYELIEELNIKDERFIEIQIPAEHFTIFFDEGIATMLLNMVYKTKLDAELSPVRYYNLKFIFDTKAQQWLIDHMEVKQETPDWMDKNPIIIDEYDNVYKKD